MEKSKLITKISTQAKIPKSKATIAYECVLKESPAFRKQTAKVVEVVKEVPVKVVNCKSYFLKHYNKSSNYMVSRRGLEPLLPP